MWQIYLHKTVVRFGAGKVLCEILTVAGTIPLPMFDQMIDGRNALQGMPSTHLNLNVLTAFWKWCRKVS